MAVEGLTSPDNPRRRTAIAYRSPLRLGVWSLRRDRVDAQAVVLGADDCRPVGKVTAHHKFQTELGRDRLKTVSVCDRIVNDD
jgi:hypothetical protein